MIRLNLTLLVACAATILLSAGCGADMEPRPRVEAPPPAAPATGWTIDTAWTPDTLSAEKRVWWNRATAQVFEQENARPWHRFTAKDMRDAQSGEQVALGKAMHVWSQGLVNLFFEAPEARLVDHVESVLAAARESLVPVEENNRTYRLWLHRTGRARPLDATFNFAATSTLVRLLAENGRDVTFWTEWLKTDFQPYWIDDRSYWGAEQRAGTAADILPSNATHTRLAMLIGHHNWARIFELAGDPAQAEAHRAGKASAIATLENEWKEATVQPDGQPLRHGDRIILWRQFWGTDRYVSYSVLQYALYAAETMPSLAFLTREGVYDASFMRAAANNLHYTFIEPERWEGNAVVTNVDIGGSKGRLHPETIDWRPLLGPNWGPAPLPSDPEAEADSDAGREPLPLGNVARGGHALVLPHAPEFRPYFEKAYYAYEQNPEQPITLTTAVGLMISAP